MNKTALLELLLAGFFAVGCIRARGPLQDGKAHFADFFRLTNRIERLRRSRCWITCELSIKGTLSASSSEAKFASVERRFALNRSSTDSRPSANAAVAKRCCKNAASPTSRNCAN